MFTELDKQNLLPSIRKSDLEFSKENKKFNYSLFMLEAYNIFIFKFRNKRRGPFSQCQLL